MADWKMTSWPVAAALPLALMVGSMGTSSCSAPENDAACRAQSSELFERRIAPLLADDQPKSCNQCHLSGLDIGSFVSANPCESMACLVKDGLVDLDEPRDSLLLSWVTRADPESDLITEDVIQAEYDALYEWIAAEADCRACSKLPCNAGVDRPSCATQPEPKEDPSAGRERDCDDKALEQLFYDTVYAFRGRCFPCHFSSNDTVDAPKWLNAGSGCEAASLATMKTVIAEGYIDVDSPARSLLLTKPLDESDGGVEHGGHDKFSLEGDLAYTNFEYFVSEYAACQTGDADP